MLEISNLRQRIEYISQISKQRDLVVQNKEFNQDINDIMEYINFCSKLSGELEGALEVKYNETVINILKNAYGKIDFSVISKIVAEHRKNSFTFNLTEPVFLKTLDSIEIVGEDVDFSKKLLSDYLFLAFGTKIEVDIENRIITSDLNWREDKVEQLLIDYVLPSESSMLEKAEQRLLESKMKWFNKLFKKEEYLNTIIELEKEVEKHNKIVSYINVFLQEDGPIDILFSEYRKEVNRFMFILADYLEKYINKQFSIQE
jgi:hypothetical protein